MLASANLLFRMIELDSIWGTFMRQIEKINFQNLESVDESLAVVSFAIDYLSIFDDSSPMIQAHILVNYILFKNFGQINGTSPYPVIITSIDLCIKLIKRICTGLTRKIEYRLNDDIDVFATCSSLANNLLTGSSENYMLDMSTSIALMLINDSQMITQNSKNIIQFHEDNAIIHESFLKSSHLLSILLDGVVQDKFDSGIRIWMETLIKELDISANINVIDSLLISLKDLMGYLDFSCIQKVLIGKTLPFIWAKYCEGPINNGELVRGLILTVCRLLPNDTDVFFSKELSNAIRNRKYRNIEQFVIFWDSSMTAGLLADIPLRLSVLILVESMSKDEFKFRRCSNIWIFSISNFLDRFLVPSLSTFIDILECSLHESSNSSALSKKVFSRNFDKGPLIYYFNIIEKLLVLNYEPVFNYLLVNDIDPYLKLQMAGIDELIKLNLDIDIYGIEHSTCFY
jgi:hypothetical protein